jgi:tight adherence protein C
MTLTMITAGGFAFLAVALCVAAVGRALTDRLSPDRRRVLSRLKALGEPAPTAPTPEPEAGGWHRAVAWVGERLAGGGKSPLAGLRAELEHAGYSHPSAPLYYLGARLTLGAVCLVGVGVLAAVALRMSAQSVAMWSVAGGLLGYVAPALVLSGRVKARQNSIRAALPDALDVMVMCVESGASVAAAVDCVADEFPAVHPLLGQQLALIRHEMQLGQTAGQAFQAFGERCGVIEVRDLAGILTQSEQYGTSVGKALRTHSEAARIERQLWCEGMAAKAAVKIMFPTLLCIFPAMFIVLLGPAAFQMACLFSR